MKLNLQYVLDLLRAVDNVWNANIYKDPERFGTLLGEMRIAAIKVEVRLEAQMPDVEILDREAS